MSATIRTVEAGGNSIAIAETGVGGRPLLLLHGLTGAKEDFVDHWDALAERGWHVVAPDLRGHGASSHPGNTDDYTIARFEADVLALVDALSWDRFVLLGHSLGGMISQLVAIHHAGRLNALILMDTIGGPVPGGGVTFFLFKVAGRIFGVKLMARVLRKPPPGSPESVRRLYAERPGWADDVQAKILASSPVMSRSLMSELHDTPDRLPDLRTLDLPVLIIAGEHDIPGFVEASQAMAEAIPGATLTVIDGAAHSPQFETPDAWWATLTTFLDSLTASAETEGER